MSTYNTYKKICIQCKIKPITSRNRKLYCDKCFIELRMAKKNKVDIMNPIIEETDIIPKSYLESSYNYISQYIQDTYYNQHYRYYDEYVDYNAYYYENC